MKKYSKETVSLDYMREKLVSWNPKLVDVVHTASPVQVTAIYKDYRQRVFLEMVKNAGLDPANYASVAAILANYAVLLRIGII